MKTNKLKCWTRRRVTNFYTNAEVATANSSPQYQSSATNHLHANGNIKARP
jgi:hypothetical protein